MNCRGVFELTALICCSAALACTILCEGFLAVPACGGDLLINPATGQNVQSSLLLHLMGCKAWFIGIAAFTMTLLVNFVAPTKVVVLTWVKSLLPKGHYLLPESAKSRI